MSGSEFSETLKFYGSIAGLIAFAFTFVDRLVRGRPDSWLTARRIGGTPAYGLKIKNVGKGDVIVRSVWTLPPVTVSKGTTVSQIAAAMSREKITSVIPAEGTVEFPVIKVTAEDVIRLVFLVIFWRKTSSAWLWQLPVVRIYSKENVRLIGDGAGAAVA